MSIIAKQFETTIEEAKSKLGMLIKEVQKYMPADAEIYLLRDRSGKEFYRILLIKRGLFRGYSLPAEISGYRDFDFRKVDFKYLFGKGNLIDIDDLPVICHNLQKGIDKLKIPIDWKKYE